MTAKLPAYLALKKQCEACPFGNTPAGKAIRESMDSMGGMFATIEYTLIHRRAYFICHRTMEKTRGTPPEKLCAGALEMQKREGVRPKVRITGYD